MPFPAVESAVSSGGQCRFRLEDEAGMRARLSLINPHVYARDQGDYSRVGVR